MSFETPPDHELASELDLLAMEALAGDLVDRVPAEVVKDSTYTLEETGASISLGTVWYEEDYQPQPSVIISLSREQYEGTTFFIGFDGQNQMTNLWFPTSEFDEALVIADELIQDENMDPELRSILRTIQNILLFTADGQSPQVAYSAADAGNSNGDHCADRTRAVVDKINGPTSLSSREFGLIYGNNEIVKVIKRTILGADAATEEEFSDIHALTIVVGKDDATQGFRYTKRINGERMLEINPDDDYSCDITDKPLHKDVAAITEALIEATLLDAEPDQETWVYPPLQFGFCFEGATTHADLVKDVFRALDATVTYVLPEYFPDGYPTQPSYLMNPKKQQRIEKYLGQKITATKQPESVQAVTVRRSEVTDMTMAIREVLDYLSETNHPVAQMVAQLYDEYALDIGFETVERVAADVVQQTHWKYVQTVLSAQVDYWRSTLNRLEVW